MGASFPMSPISPCVGLPTHVVKTPLSKRNRRSLMVGTEAKGWLCSGPRPAVRVGADPAPADRPCTVDLDPLENGASVWSRERSPCGLAAPRGRPLRPGGRCHRAAGSRRAGSRDGSPRQAPGDRHRHRLPRRRLSPNRSSRRHRWRDVSADTRFCPGWPERIGA